jgi:cytochrome c-L
MPGPGIARETSLLRILTVILAAAVAGLAPGVAAQDIPRKPDGTIQFRHALDNQPLEMEFRPQQRITPAVERFHRTGENPYSGDEAAIRAGRSLWQQWCVSCHLPDGTGRIGPSLVDDRFLYPRVATDIGMFEVIYAGAGGAMQAFGRRMDQDAILRLMAYVETLGAPRGGRR